MTEGGAGSWKGNKAISLVLRTGVLISVALVLAGGALYLARYGNLQPQYSVFQEEAADLKSVTGIIGRAARGSARGLVQFGLLVLILTPMARVVTTLILFVEERDRLYTGITALVLVALLLGFFMPKGF